MTVGPWIAAMFLAASTSAAAEKVKVIDAEFFLQDARIGEASIKPGSIVPNRPETSCYFWVVFVEPSNRIVKVREAFKLPAPARQWGNDPTAPTNVIKERNGAVTEFDDDLSDGALSHGWCVAEGDPSGPHQIRVYADDQLLRIFDFQVVPELY